MMQQINSKNTETILSELRDVLARGVSGDVVEFGCYAGDTSVELARILKSAKSAKNLQNPAKKLFLYDSFEGLPAKTPEDSSSLGESFQSGELKTGKKALLTRFSHLSLPLPIIKKAWFSDLDPAADLPAQIAFALLDGDFYASLQTSFALIENKLQPGSVVIVDDYANPALPGVRLATDQWLAHYKKYCQNQPKNQTQNKDARLSISDVLAIITIK